MGMTWDRNIDARAAIHLPEDRIDRLGRLLRELQFDHERRMAMSSRARELGETHRRGALVELIDQVAAS